MMRTFFRRGAPLAALLLGLVAGCQRNLDKNATTGSGTTTTVGSGALQQGSGSAAPARDIDSKDILARAGADVAAETLVKHVLVSWKDLADVFGGQQDPRGAERTNAQAADLALELAGKLKADPTQIDALIKEHTEDKASIGGEGYPVTPTAGMVDGFKNLALRLKLGEVGVVKSEFGYHVMIRVVPPPPDPLESADVLARPVVVPTTDTYFKHVLIRWKDSPLAAQVPLDERATNRTKAEADVIAQDVLGKARLAGADMAALMKQFSEDPNSKETGEAYPVPPDVPQDDKLIKMLFRLKDNEVALVKTEFGWHVLQRVPAPPPPPPDTLQTLDILARAPVTTKATVKHILLGWDKVNSGDPRAVKRDRKALEALVAKTVGQLKKGAKIEALMKELSEDPGSAQSGDSYDATPDARLVPPFKDLAMRLNVGEVGVVKTDFGIHIMQRVADKAAEAPAPAAGSAAPAGSAAAPN